MTADRLDNAGNPDRQHSEFLPGSRLAIAHGCTCVEVEGLFRPEWDKAGCPLHDPRRQQADERVPW